MELLLQQHRRWIVSFRLGLFWVRNFIINVLLLVQVWAALTFWLNLSRLLQFIIRLFITIFLSASWRAELQRLGDRFWTALFWIMWLSTGRNRMAYTLSTLGFCTSNIWWNYQYWLLLLSGLTTLLGVVFSAYDRRHSLLGWERWLIVALSRVGWELNFLGTFDRLVWLNRLGVVETSFRLLKWPVIIQRSIHRLCQMRSDRVTTF